VADAEDRAGAVTVAYVHNADGKNLAHSWHHSMIELIGWDLANEARILRGGYIAMKHGTDGLADARNKAVKLFLAEGKADWLFWVDTDMGFAADTVDRLLEAADPVERPIVGGLAFTWREDSQDGMGGWRTSPAPTIFDWRVLDDGQMGFVVRLNYQPDALTACAGTGSACILIHRGVFERVKAEYGEHWYDRIPNTTTGQLVSEDLSLCLRAGALKIPVHVDASVRTTHQKVIWVGEDDYMAARVLAAMPPPVPAATEATAVIVPVLGRPGNAAPFMASLKASGAPLAKVYAVADQADAETAAAWLQTGATVIVRPLEEGRGTFAQKVNCAYERTTEPWLLLTGDDVRFHPGWLDHAQHAARDGADVVGTNDMHNPRCASGEWSPHPLIRRAYADEVGASWDGPKVVAHEGYRHNFPDDEIAAAAKQRGGWAFASHAKVEALHPMWGNAADDATYALGREHFEADKALFEKRRAEHAGTGRPS
jgi:glycosyl transferase family 2